jgi:hypothetical protein
VDEERLFLSFLFFSFLDTSAAANAGADESTRLGLREFVEGGRWKGGGGKVPARPMQGRAGQGRAGKLSQ